MTNRGWVEDLNDIARSDVDQVIQKDKEYGSSWKSRGGQGAFFQGIARKWDRIEPQIKMHGYDLFAALKADTRKEGLRDDLGDLRRYLLLLEAEIISWGQNIVPASPTKPSFSDQYDNPITVGAPVWHAAFGSGVIEDISSDGEATVSWPRGVTRVVKWRTLIKDPNQNSDQKHPFGYDSEEAAE